MQSLEPQVIQSINRSRRRMRLAEGSVFAVVPLLLISVTGSYIAILQLRPAHVETPGEVAFLAGFFASVVMIGVAIQMVANYQYEQKGFRYLLAQRVHMRSAQHKAAYSRVRAALDAVSIGMGAERSQPSVLDIPGPNAIAFEDERGFECVGVTMALLTTHQNPYELEAVLAHQVAHVMTGNIMRRPRLFDAKRTLNLIIGLSMASVFVGIALVPHTESLLIGPQTILYGLAVFLSVVAIFSFRRLDRYYRYDDFLADSVAAKVTGGAGYLLETIRQAELVYSTMRANQTCPETGSACRHFLVPPSPERWSTNRGLYGTVNPWWMKKFKNAADNMTEQRLENLQAIERGHGPGFAQA